MSKYYKQLQPLPKSIQVKAMSMAKEISLGKSLFELGGKRLQCCKKTTFIISAPIGNKYRMLIKKVGNTLKPYWVGSHAAYNTKITHI